MRDPNNGRLSVSVPKDKHSAHNILFDAGNPMHVAAFNFDPMNLAHVVLVNEAEKNA